MQCSNCGVENKEGSKFCESCGCELNINQNEYAYEEFDGVYDFSNSVNSNNLKNEKEILFKKLQNMSKKESIEYVKTHPRANEIMQNMKPEDWSTFAFGKKEKKINQKGSSSVSSVKNKKRSRFDILIPFGILLLINFCVYFFIIGMPIIMFNKNNNNGVEYLTEKENIQTGKLNNFEYDFSKINENSSYKEVCKIFGKEGFVHDKAEIVGKTYAREYNWYLDLNNDSKSDVIVSVIIKA